MGNIPLHAKAVPRLDVGAQTSNSSISDPCDLSPRDVELTALPPQAAPREHPPQTGNAVVGIFWDYENVRVPGNKTTAGAVDAIRRLALEHGTVVEQRLYYDSRHETEQYTDRINLDMSGFTLVDCPKRNNVKETLDKKLIVDVMSFRIKLENSCVVLITSDGDYAYALNMLRGFGVKTVVIHGPSAKTAGALLDSADVAVSFADLINPPIDEEPESTSSVSSVAPTLPPTAVVPRQPNILYIHCVLEHSGDKNAWVVDSYPADSFYKKSGSSEGAKTNAEKKMLRTARDAAIRDGFVEAGRLHNLACEVVAVRSAYWSDLTEEQKEQLSSTHFSIRITDKGRFRLHPDWTPSA